MRNVKTRINALHVAFGESDDSQEVYIQRDSTQDDIYGYFFCGNVTLFFNSKEAIDALQNKLTELKEGWLVEEQKEVTASA